MVSQTMRSIKLPESIQDEILTYVQYKNETGNNDVMIPLMIDNLE